MPLWDIAECNDKKSGDNLWNGGIKVNMFHKKFEEKIVQEQAKTYSYQVPEKLYPASQGRSRKNNEPHQ